MAADALYAGTYILYALSATYAGWQLEGAGRRPDWRDAGNLQEGVGSRRGLDLDRCKALPAAVIVV